MIVPSNYIILLIIMIFKEILAISKYVKQVSPICAFSWLLVSIFLSQIIKSSRFFSETVGRIAEECFHLACSIELVSGFIFHYIYQLTIL